MEEWIKTLVNLSIGLGFGVIGTLIGAFINHRFVRGREKKKEKEGLATKELLFKEDLLDKKRVLLRLEKVFKALRQKLENRESLQGAGDVFQDLHVDIYESVSKADLYKIFKEDFFILIDVYKAILHLKDRSPVDVRNEYLETKNLYYKEFANVPAKEFMDRITDIGLTQIKTNLNTIEQLHDEIDFLIHNIDNPNKRVNNDTRKLILNSKGIQI